MRIVFLLSDLRRVGPTNQTLNIAKSASLKYDVLVVTLFEEESTDNMFEEYMSAGLCVKCLCLNRTLFFRNFRRKIQQIISSPDSTVIQSNGIKCDLLSATILKPLGYIVCSTIRNIPTEDLPGRKNRYFGLFLALLHLQAFKSIKFRLSCSMAIHDVLKSKFNIDTKVIANGTDCGRFRFSQKARLDIRHNLKISQNSLVCISTNSFIKRKNQDKLLSEFLRCKRDSCFLILLGDGPLYEPLKEKYGNRENIRFVGKVSNVEDYLSASDVFLSLSMSEGLPNSALEALSNGLYLMLSDIPQHSEIERAYPDRVKIVNEASSMAEEIEGITLNSRIVDKAVIEPGNIFSKELMSQSYIAYYERVINEAQCK